MAQNNKKFCLSHFVSQELYIIWLWFLIHTRKMMISPANFFIFQNFDFGGFLGGKRIKNDLKLPISVCFTLYIRNCRSYHQDIDNDIYRYWHFSLFFSKKCNIVNIKIISFLLAHFNSFFNNYLIFRFINKCQKEILRCAPPSSHMCNFYYKDLAFYIMG